MGTSSLRGQLLVAGPAMLDPNFARTVVLVGEHSDEGAMGIVLNRPAPVSVAEAVPVLGDVVEPDASVHAGGPVQPEAVTVLAEWDEPESAAVVVFGDIGFMRADAETEEVAPSMRRARVFAGYAGWGAGQLEAELEETAWFVEPAEPDDVFAADADGLWSAVLRRKGGRYALIATMPVDPSVN